MSDKGVWLLKCFKKVIARGKCAKQMLEVFHIWAERLAEKRIETELSGARPPFHSPVFACSNLWMRSANSGRRESQPCCFLNLASGLAGVPQTVWPRRMVFPLGI